MIGIMCTRIDWTSPRFRGGHAWTRGWRRSRRLVMGEWSALVVLRLLPC